jgi:cysteine desulfurase/selenocysteine lyase
MGAAIDYLQQVGMDQIEKYEQAIVTYGLNKIKEIDEVKLFGAQTHHRGAVFSFALDGIHPHDVAQLLDREGIAVRAGHHCAMPLHKKYDLPATTRASFYLYNDKHDFDALCVGIKKVIILFK